MRSSPPGARRLPAVLLALLLAGPAAAQPCVILLHGLGRTQQSMGPLATALTQAGYHSVNIDYPSRSAPIEALAQEALPRGIGQCRREQATPIHVVTHSMGALLLRYYLTQQPLAELGRVVMLAPPNQGSEMADALKDNIAYRHLNGPAGQQLGTGPSDLAAQLGPVHYPTGVLIGNERTALDQLLPDVLPRPNDGKVAVERAKVQGMADFMVLGTTHTFIMNEPHNRQQVLHFLAHGRFAR
jgi:triacylglycerol lipase